MILTVTLNAAVDKTFRIENFTIDRVHRPTEWRIVAGGKGINVARVYQALGGRAVATGFLGGYNGQFIARSLEKEGIAARFVTTGEESRECIAVIDPITNTQTEINEVGPHVTEREIEQLKSVFARLVQETSFAFITFSGSTPPGVPDTIYADLIRIAEQHGARCVLDTSGAALAAGITALPWMIKPNIFELSALTHTPQTEQEAVIEGALSLAKSGIEVVCVTMGKAGCIGVAEGSVWQAVPPSIRFVSAVGSGDAFVGAFLWAQENKWDFADSLRLATGAGAANAEVFGAGLCTADHIRRLAEKVEVTCLGETR